MREALLEREREVQKILILSVVPESTRTRIMEGAPLDGWSDELLTAVLPQVGFQSSGDSEFLRVLFENTAVIGISGRTVEQVAWVYMMVIGDVFFLTGALKSCTNTREEVLRLLDGISALVANAEQTEQILKDYRALIEAEYRQVMGDDALPFSGGSTFVWSDRDWLIPGEILASYKRDEPLFRQADSPETS